MRENKLEENGGRHDMPMDARMAPTALVVATYLSIRIVSSFGVMGILNALAAAAHWQAVPSTSSAAATEMRRLRRYYAAPIHCISMEQDYIYPACGS